MCRPGNHALPGNRFFFFFFWSPSSKTKQSKQDSVTYCCTLLLYCVLLYIFLAGKSVCDSLIKEKEKEEVAEMEYIFAMRKGLA